MSDLTPPYRQVDRVSETTDRSEEVVTQHDQPCPAQLCEPNQRCPHNSLPFPVGTVLRCTRWTEWGTETVYGTVEFWHNGQGWLVGSPHGGIAASPGPGAFFDLSEPTLIRVESEEWRFEPVHPVIEQPAASDGSHAHG